MRFSSRSTFAPFRFVRFELPLLSSAQWFIFRLLTDARCSACFRFDIIDLSWIRGSFKSFVSLISGELLLHFYEDKSPERNLMMYFQIILIGFASHLMHLMLAALGMLSFLWPLSIVMIGSFYIISSGGSLSSIVIMALCQYLMVTHCFHYKPMSIIVPMYFLYQNMIDFWSSNRCEIDHIFSPLISIEIISCFRCISWGMDRINATNLNVIENNDYLTSYTVRSERIPSNILDAVEYLSYILSPIGLGTLLFYPFHIHHRYLHGNALNTFAINSTLLIGKVYQCSVHLLMYWTASYLNEWWMSQWITIYVVILRMYCLQYSTEIMCFLNGCTNECDIKTGNQWIWCKNCNEWMGIYNVISLKTLCSSWNISLQQFARKYVIEAWMSLQRKTLLSLAVEQFVSVFPLLLSLSTCLW